MRVYCRVKSVDNLAGYWPFKEGHDVKIGDLLTLKKIFYGSSYTIFHVMEREEPLNSILFDTLDENMDRVDIYSIDFMNRLISESLS